jgi:hypothetical protein
MARTKAEVRAFLNSLVGSIVVNKGNSDYNGQCVTLTKALLEFLGIPNPYAARGDAKDAGDTYIRQGIGVAGRGWLTIVVNRDMGLIQGVRYGHIWVDLADEANYESNGARALYVTKNTRPISQGQQFINLDKWITDEGAKAMIPDQDNWYARFRKLMLQIRGRDMDRGEFRKNFVGVDPFRMVEVLADNPEADQAQRWQEVGKVAVTDKWDQQIYNLQAALKGTVSKADLEAAQKAADTLRKQLDQANIDAEQKVAEKQALSAKIAEYERQAQADKEAGDSLLRRIGQFISKYLPGGK